MNKNKVASSLFFKFTEALAVKGIGLVISIILARLLVPEAFGQIAVLGVLINLSQTIIQSGLNTALVQRQDVSEVDYSTIFFISTGLSFPLIGILCLTAPWLAAYMEIPELVLPLRVYSLSLLFSGYNSVQIARMQKKMNFKAMMLASLMATVLAGVVGVTMAFLDFGIWALVGYYVSAIVFSCGTMFLFDRWIPKLLFSWARARVLFSYGWKMLVSAILCSIYGDIRSLIIGKKYSTEALGYYNRGHQFPTVISSTLDNTVQTVMFPTMATVQDDREQMRGMLKRTLTLGSMMTLPAMVGLAMIAEPLILLLLTEKWLPSVVFMQIICLADASLPLSSSNLVAIKAMGRSDVYMKLEIVRRVAMVVVLLISVCCFHSVLAVAIGYVISSWIDWAITTIATKKLLNYGLLQQLKDTWKIFVATLIMAAVILAMNWLPVPLIVKLIIQILFGIGIYFGCCYLLKLDSLQYILSILKSKKATNNKQI